MAKKRVWNSGPPPHVGWWNASMREDNELWRWWDGKQWSRWAKKVFSAEDAAKQASRRAPYQDAIEWTYYWPKRARVFRVNPNLRWVGTS